jgi:Cupin domain
VVREAPLVRTEAGLAPAAEGWFILNARDACWFWDGRSACSEFEGEYEFQQVGIFLRVLSPGVPMGLYHRETDQEAFLVLSGEALLVVEGEERPLRRWDFFHCPPGTSWPSARASTSGARTGARTRWTRRLSATVPASLRRRPTERRRMPELRRPS